MKRFVALCLVIACIALPLSVTAADHCYCKNCHGWNASEKTSHLTSYDSTYHYLEFFFYKECADCGHFEFLDWGPVGIGKHQLQHFKQWVTSTVTYEYDKCSFCGAILNTQTIYH